MYCYSFVLMKCCIQFKILFCNFGHYLVPSEKLFSKKGMLTYAYPIFNFSYYIDCHIFSLFKQFENATLNIIMYISV